MTTSQKDALSFLTEQHEIIRDLFAQIPLRTGKEKEDAFEMLVRLLAVHETAEEMVVYPTVKASGAEGTRIADARLAEEDEAKKVLADLVRLDVSTVEFDAAFAAFQTSVESHASAEEREVFPLLEQTKDDAQPTRMTAALQVAQSMAPTHAHKSAPETALGNLLVGPYVAMADRVKDAIRDATR